MSDGFEYDVFLSYSAKDTAVVRPLAERLRADGVKVWFDEWVLKPGDSIPAKIDEGLERSRVLVLCMSAHAFGSDWAQLESGTFRFRDPLNKERRFLPLRLDDTPIKGSLAQFLYINWLPADHGGEYPKLLATCRLSTTPTSQLATGQKCAAEKVFELPYPGHRRVIACAFSSDGRRALIGADENILRLWDVEEGRCVRELKAHTGRVKSVVWSADQRRALSGSSDNTVRVWDVETGRWISRFEGHNYGISTVSWSANQRLILSGSEMERSFRVCDVETGRQFSEGKLIYQSIGRDGVPAEMKRLPSAEERVVLGEMERQLEQRYLCLRQGNQLVFPSHCGRDRPAVVEHPSVFVSYAVKGFLDDIYATLVVKLAASESFKLAELWRDAADFVTLAGEHHMGIKLTRESGSQGDISVYFGKGVAQQEQVIFANYIHGHLEGTCESKPERLRHYVCPHCHEPKGNPAALVKRLLAKKQEADTECDACGGRFPLWDALEKKFASEAVRRQVEELQADDVAKLTTRRKGKLLVLDVGARITSANQKWMEVARRRRRRDRSAGRVHR